MKSQREIFLTLCYNVKLIFTLPIVMLVYFEQTEEHETCFANNSHWTKLVTSYLSSCPEVTID